MRGGRWLAQPDVYERAGLRVVRPRGTVGVRDGDGLDGSFESRTSGAASVVDLDVFDVVDGKRSDFHDVGTAVHHGRAVFVEGPRRAAVHRVVADLNRI